MHTEQFNVTGMTCGGCTEKVTRALNGVDGVSDVNVSLATGEANVRFDERVASAAQLKSAIEAAGYVVGRVEHTDKEQAKDKLLQLTADRTRHDEG